METIYFKRNTKFLGRNGKFNCSGLHFTDNRLVGEDNISIEPITSKDLVGRCRIEIPREEVLKVADQLTGNLITAILDNIPDSLPLLLGLNPALDRAISERLKK